MKTRPLTAPSIGTSSPILRGPACATGPRPEQAGLLGLLAVGAGDGVIGIRGTGEGIRLGWLAAAASAGARLVAVDSDPGTARQVADRFAGDPRVRAHCGDLRALLPGAPYDLLVVDAPATPGPGGPPVDPGLWLRPGGMLVIDAVRPAAQWPPRFDDGAESARLHWLRHPHLCTAELRLAPDLAALVATYVGPDLAR
jgi:predicted O-methyltransferase YrrM